MHPLYFCLLRENCNYFYNYFSIKIYKYMYIYLYRMYMYIYGKSDIIKSSKENNQRRKGEPIMKKLYTRYNEDNNTLYTGNFKIVEKIPEVGDYWNGTGCEVIAVEQVNLDDIVNERSFGAKFEAYKVSYINCGFDEEREDPFVDYIAIELKDEDEMDD